jgi:[ribosomal protein S5]-alanine N-acetyltransferase
MHITLPGCIVRDWHTSDAPSLAKHANDRRIWRNLRDIFPHPYALADAEKFLAIVTAQSPVTNFAIVVDGEAAGGIGYRLQSDVERVSAEIGYWLGAEFWGRGIMTSAVQAVTEYAFVHHPELQRLFAVPFAWSGASARVLEKAGYEFEGRMRRSAVKDGQVTDQLLYAMLRTEAG